MSSRAEGADKEAIRQAIVTMPNYFVDYDTTVHFISMEEMRRDHSGIPHGGFVIHTGRTGKDGEHGHVIEYRLQLDSNPRFTSSVLVACARAVYRMEKGGPDRLQDPLRCPAGLPLAQERRGTAGGDAVKAPAARKFQ